MARLSVQQSLYVVAVDGGAARHSSGGPGSSDMLVPGASSLKG